ncbi:hypothetical protein Btru_023684 [Bulinus truncatus]|nr:hypothetical protein Btru_023684 [Bulinus truncatus]
MAASCTQPVAIPANYYPAFKVEVLLQAPIQVYQTTESDLHIDLMTLSYQLDTVCRQGLAKVPENKRSSILRNSKEYFVQLSAMHHIISLSKQIHEEVTHQSRPKYLAHQLALLYQAIVNLPSGEDVLSKHKKNLEDNFPTLKSYLSKLSVDSESVLSSDVREWVLDFTDSLIQGIRSLPKAMTKPLVPLAMSFT